MKQLLFFLLIVMPAPYALSQMTVRAFLDSIIANNKNLSASRLYYDAQKIDAKTGKYLPNPSVTYDELNNASGNYSELTIAQSFDFPTAYYHKSQISNLSISKADDLFRQSKLEILIDAIRVYAELVYLNREINILENRRLMANQLKAGTDKRMLLGDVHVFEVNRVNTEFAMLKSEIQIAESRRSSLLQKLAEINGGISMVVKDTIFPEPADFNINDSILTHLVDQNPQVKQWEAESMIAQRNISLQRSLTFPKLELGYRQDMNSGQTFKGIHAGITVPLFENKNMIRYAKARQIYTNNYADAQRHSVRNSISRLYSEYMAMQQSAGELNDVFKTLNTPALLYKAYYSGQISYTELFTEYDNYNQTLLYLENLLLKLTSLQLELYVLSAL